MRYPHLTEYLIEQARTHLRRNGHEPTTEKVVNFLIGGRYSRAAEDAAEEVLTRAANGYATVIRSPDSGRTWGVAIDRIGGEETVTVTELEPS